ncbi:Transposable element Tcb1 transposase [Anthophora plagiata]
MQWPPQSSDLNPIEKLWDEFDRQVRDKCTESEKQLWTMLKTIWGEIKKETLQKLIAKLPRLVQAVISQRGGHIDGKKI